MVKPRALRPGDTIGIVAPAGPVDPGKLSDGIKRLESLGFKTLLGESVYRSYRYLAGHDQERLGDLVGVYQKPEVRAVIAARGGYGTLRLIPHLTPRLFLQDPKIVVGSSDLTFLLLYLLKQCGLVVFHGPMVAPNFGHVPSSLTDDFFLKVLSPRISDETLTYPSVEALKNGMGEGVLTGGCLSMVCGSIGTPFEIETEGHVLFLEDTNEPPFRIDRVLNYLKATGKLKGIRGIIFGKMDRCHPSQEAGYTLQEVLLDSLTDFKGPILYGFPSGHGGDNVTLPFGLRVSVDGKRGRVILLEQAVVSS